MRVSRVWNSVKNFGIKLKFPKIELKKSHKHFVFVCKNMNDTL